MGLMAAVSAWPVWSLGVVCLCMPYLVPLYLFRRSRCGARPPTRATGRWSQVTPLPSRAWQVVGRWSPPRFSGRRCLAFRRGGVGRAAVTTTMWQGAGPK